MRWRLARIGRSRAIGRSRIIGRGRAIGRDRAIRPLTRISPSQAGVWLGGTDFTATGKAEDHQANPQEGSRHAFHADRLRAIGRSIKAPDRRSGQFYIH